MYRGYCIQSRERFQNNFTLDFNETHTLTNTQTATYENDNAIDWINQSIDREREKNPEKNY